MEKVRTILPTLFVHIATILNITGLVILVTMLTGLEDHRTILGVVVAGYGFPYVQNAIRKLIS